MPGLPVHAAASTGPMTTFALRYQGSLRCELRHGPSGNQVLTDAPVDNHGLGQSFSPTDLAASSLGVCMATVMGIVAQRDQIALDGLTADLEKRMSAAAPRRIAQVVVRFRMPKGIPAARRPVLEQAARTCPVALSLHPDIVQDVSFAYPD
jgi:putative redox protein